MSMTHGSYPEMGNTAESLGELMGSETDRLPKGETFSSMTPSCQEGLHMYVLDELMNGS
jgi:hypothetical protein